MNDNVFLNNKINGNFVASDELNGQLIDRRSFAPQSFSLPIPNSNILRFRFQSNFGSFQIEPIDWSRSQAIKMGSPKLMWISAIIASIISTGE